jgi:hypothetical protein
MPVARITARPDRWAPQPYGQFQTSTLPRAPCTMRTTSCASTIKETTNHDTCASGVAALDAALARNRNPDGMAPPPTIRNTTDDPARAR